MNLTEAITRAAVFAGDPKMRNIMACLRLLPASGYVPARIFATDNMTGIVIDMEPHIDLPNVAIDATALVDAVRKFPEPALTDNDQAWIWVHNSGADPVTGIRIGKYDHTKFPGLPDPNLEFDFVRNVGAIPLVLHACSKDTLFPEQHYVRFRPGWVEATDSNRIARVAFPLFRHSIVYSKVFQDWPGGDAHIGFGAERAWFRLDAELRFTAVYRGDDIRPYPDLDWALAGCDNPPTQAIVSKRPLLDAIRQASKHSQTKVVRLQFESEAIRVTPAVNDKLTVEGHTFRVPALCRDQDTFVASAPLLVDAVGQIETPRLFLGAFQRDDRPLMIASSNFEEHIWPARVLA